MPRNHTITPEEAQRLIEHLRAQVERAEAMRYAARQALERAQARPDWQRICDLTGTNPDADYGDWSC